MTSISTPDFRAPGFTAGRSDPPVVHNKLFRPKDGAAFRELCAQVGVPHIPYDEKLLKASEGSSLAQEIAVGGMMVGNRFAISPMEGWDGLGCGEPSLRTLARLERQGKSGAALLWGLEAYAVQSDGRANPLQLYYNEGLDPERQLRLIHRTVMDAHEDRFGSASAEKTLAILQLTHSGRWCKPNLNNKFEPRIAYNHPLLDKISGIAAGDRSRIWTDAQLDDLTKQFVKAAKTAWEAGFKGVDIKCCHGYLLHEFLSAYSREGDYGGSFDGRTRLMRQIIREVKRECPDIIIGVRLSAFDTLPYVKDPDFIFDPSKPNAPIPGKLAAWDSAAQGDYPVFGADRTDPRKIDLTEAIKLVRVLEAEGVHAINVTAASPYYNSGFQRPTILAPLGAAEPTEHTLVATYRHIAATHTLQHEVSIPVVVSGVSGLQEHLPNVAQALVRNGHASFFGMGRAFLSYPDIAADILEQGELNKAGKVCRMVGACTSIVRATDPVTKLPLGDSGCLPFNRDFRGEQAALKEYERSLIDNAPPPLVIPNIADLTFNRSHYDFASAGDVSDMALMSANIGKLNPGYSIRQVEIKAGESLTINAEARMGNFYVLQAGKAQIQFTESGQIYKDAAAKSADMTTGDLLHTAGADIAKVTAVDQDIKLWVIDVEGRLENFTYRRGVTRLAHLPQEFSEPASETVPFSPSTEFRKLLFSSHTQHQPGKNLPLEMHVELFNPNSTSAQPPELGVSGQARPHELRLAIDHKALGLKIDQDQSRVTTWPDATKNEGLVTTNFNLGDVVSIPYGVGHQAVGAMVVVTLPGSYGSQT